MAMTPAHGADGTAGAEAMGKSKRITAITYARGVGDRDGRSAASWFEMDAFGGRVTRGAGDAARRIIKGIDDGDPEVLDALPSPDLSGEWADRVTGPSLAADALGAAGLDDPDAKAYREAYERWFDDICGAYEAAFTDAATEEVYRTAKIAAK
jgi:hypothetical protein